ncbi:MAG: DUF721 domain-containing protein [Sphaerochaetaceae bacterium]|jgi:predicted nucleic acid-binding Zn ribbon protein|nr:DUF721 domain-containing protein [Sphaerochaetaceae bacterium]MDD2405282.1 DUF721 domain-containing protein [Sphaerochaetaceae bacterium]MDD3670840.1 DUF721 domain-containing protein [Sphaerochaetaceae bacterium]MDD4258438.1 DUF721 domain-containing protein [Sphaerochaetaceae bacterium]MDD4763017.1 DUF721 domain-containing protein [Sphaerochaetaceae bacterium]
MPDKSAAQLLDILLAKLKCDGSNPNVALVRNWVEVVGSDIALHTKIIDIKGSTLIVKADHPTWATIITMRKQAIVEKISLLYPDLGIKRVQVRIGSDT